LIWHFFRSTSYIEHSKSVYVKSIKIRLAERTIDAGFYSGGEGVLPGVVFLHDLMGIVPATKMTAEALAAEGFHVLVPNLYAEIGGPKYCVRQMFVSAIRHNEETENPHLEEIQEILGHFKKMPEVNEEKLGIVGQCLTGGFVLHAAIRRDVKAPVVFHHSFGLKGSGIPAHCSALIEGQVQGHFVNIDPFCPKTRVGKLKQQLGTQLEEYWYDLPHGIPHFFFNNKQGQLAYQRMLGFIKENLLS
jgi:carboxymethylenebutenolidase